MFLDLRLNTLIVCSFFCGRKMSLVKENQFNQSDLTCCFCFRYDDLEGIFSQLNSSKTRQMVALLEQVESCYCPALTNMKHEVLMGESSVHTHTHTM